MNESLPGKFFQLFSQNLLNTETRLIKEQHPEINVDNFASLISFQYVDCYDKCLVDAQFLS